MKHSKLPARMPAHEFVQMYSKKAPENVFRGRRNRDNGLQFEAYIKNACEYYKEEKIARVKKTDEPMRIAKDLGNGKFIAFFKEQSDPDFKGLLAGGQSVAFEAKHTNSDRIDKGAVSAKQEEFLNEHHDYGAIVFVMVSFALKKYYRIPWTVWREMKQLYGRKYLLEEEIAEFEVPSHCDGRQISVLFLEDIGEMPVKVQLEATGD